jgi:AraC family transcriptional activator of tynA and feaB
VETLFSTKDVHPRDRFDYWHNVACKNLVAHDSYTECRQTFTAEMQGGRLADVGLVLFENTSMAVAHTRCHVDQARNDDLFVCRQVAGLLELEQNGREAAIEPGDITLLDPLLPYAGRFSSGSKLLVLKVPRRALEARVGNTREMIIRSIKPTETENGLTSSFLAMLPGYTDKMGPAATDIIKDQTLDLVAVSLAKAMELHRPKVSSVRSLALLNVRAAIAARLSDPALDPATVAAAAGISVRYANAVLAQEEGTSLARLIQARRLARCRRALEDPLQMHRTISEIAYGWGFSDMTHFGRRFKAAYGMSPTEYRNLATQSEAPNAPTCAS